MRRCVCDRGYDESVSDDQLGGLAGLHSMDHGCCATMDGLGSAAERARDARERCQGTLGDQGHLRDGKEKGKH